MSPHTAAANEAIAPEVDRLLRERCCVEKACCHVSVEDVEKCIDSLKCHKAPYLDNICSEHLIHAGPHLIVHLSLLFNSMIHHCMVPSDFCNGFILPLLKNKHGDATDVNMYRGITISPVISKLFESILLRLFDSFLTSRHIAGFGSVN